MIYSVSTNKLKDIGYTIEEQKPKVPTLDMQKHENKSCSMLKAFKLKKK